MQLSLPALKFHVSGFTGQFMQEGKLLAAAHWSSAHSSRAIKHPLPPLIFIFALNLHFCYQDDLRRTAYLLEKIDAITYRCEHTYTVMDGQEMTSACTGSAFLTTLIDFSH